MMCIKKGVVEAIRKVCPWIDSPTKGDRRLRKEEFERINCLLILMGLSNQIKEANRIVFDYMSENNCLDSSQNIISTIAKLKRPSARIIERDIVRIDAVDSLDGVFKNKLESCRSLPCIDLCGLIMYSAIRNGLLLRKELIVEFYNQLNNKPYMLKGVVWYELPLIEGKHVQVWVPDSITLALLGIWYENKCNSSFVEINNKSYFDVMKSTFSYGEFLWNRTGLNKEKLFLESVLKRLSIDLPSYLIDSVSGVIDNRSLDPICFHRLLSGLSPCLPKSKDHIKASRYKKSVYSETSLNLQNKSDGFIYNKLLDCFKGCQPDHKKKLVGKIKKIISNNNSLLSPTMNYLCRWCVNRLEGRNWYGHKSSVATMRMKLSKISDELLAIFGSIEPRDVESDELIDLYEEVIKEGGNKNRFSETIGDYHDFLVTCCGVEDMGSGSLWASPREKFSNVDANIITQLEFDTCVKYYKKQIERLSRNKDERRIMKIRLIVFIIGFYTGLRRKELIYLRIKDFTRLGTKEILVRPIDIRTLKSINCIRRILVEFQIPNEFIEDIEELIFFRKNLGAKDSDLLFFKDNDGGVSEISIFGHIQWLLQIVTGNPKARFHHCRHSFASWALWRWSSLHLNVYEPWSSILPNYDKRVVEKEYSALFSQSDVRYPSNSMLYEMARTLGHSSPQMGLEHYLHTPSLIAHISLQDSSLKLSTKIISEIIGVSLRRAQQLTKNQSRNIQIIDKVSLRRISKVSITPNLTGWIEPDLKRIGVRGREADYEEVDEFNIWNALVDRKLNSLSVDALSKSFQLNKCVFEKCVKEYELIEKMTFPGSGHNTNRHLKKKGGLIMDFPREKIHLRTAELMIANYRKLPGRKRSRVDWCVDYYITNGQVNRPSLRFNDVNELSRFLKIFQDLDLDCNGTQGSFYRITLNSCYPYESIERCKQWLYWGRVIDGYRNQTCNIIKKSGVNEEGYVELAFITDAKGPIVDSVRWPPDLGFKFALYVIAVTRGSRNFS